MPANDKNIKCILVNGYNSTHGGGLRIFEGFVRHLVKNAGELKKNTPTIIFSPLHDQSFVKEAMDAGMHTRIFHVVGIKFIDQAILYFFYLPLRNKKEMLINFGDLIVPMAKNQLYYFDWLYAAIEAPAVWKSMPIKQRIARYAKRLTIKALINTPKLVTVQSKFIANQVAAELGRIDVIIMPCPVNVDTKFKRINNDASKMKNVNAARFLCLSSFATHKNIEILLDVAIVLKKRGTNAQIILTLDQKDPNVEMFIQKVAEYGLTEYIKNVGVLNFEQVNEWLDNCDALLLPTKLETFGLPYVESLARKTQVLTSDLPFAHEICKTGSLFFNPDDPQDIANAIERLINGDCPPVSDQIINNIIEQCRPDRVYSEILAISYSA